MRSKNITEDLKCSGLKCIMTFAEAMQEKTDVLFRKVLHR